jgi:hypothetical protein
MSGLYMYKTIAVAVKVGLSDLIKGKRRGVAFSLADEARS